MNLYVRIIVFIILVLIEALTAQLTTIWFAVGALLAIVASAFRAPDWIQWTVFLVSSLLLLIFTRKIILKLFKAEPKPTNTDRVIGENGIVFEEINNLAAQGAVKVDGTIWTARSENDDIIPIGTTVTVRRIEGVKLIVQKNN